MDEQVTEQEPQLLSKQNMRIWIGLAIIGVLLLAITGFYLPPSIARSSLPGNLNQTRLGINFKIWGLTLKMYANDNPGKAFPPLTQHDGLWVPDLELLYPEYLTELDLAADPDSRDSKKQMLNISDQDTPDIEKATRLMAQSYVYPGWVVQSMSDVKAIRRFHEEENLRTGDIRTEDERLYWINHGVERLIVDDINDPGATAMAESNIPVMIARPRPEPPKYTSNIIWWRYYFDKYLFGKPPKTVVRVLFLDGHSENILLEYAPDYIKALIELFPEKTDE